jgi:SET domain-containing protein
MMRVPCTIGESKIHGLGVFALADIPAKKVVWSWSRIFDHPISEYVWVHIPEGERDKLLERGYRPPNRPEVIVMCGDEAAYLNFPAQGEEANTVVSGYIDEYDVLAAAREIKAGQEITVPPESDADYERKIANRKG